ncbi:MAG: hypothetical protein CVV41_16305 [Candidatus Riflebacteria bacterium HGW-Riflebacteria-1]|nr:MAG: hypothetical protein CVV41_16305 [Candidatus Riflebacteria bacterium HGW-Riflebacteria-1]
MGIENAGLFLKTLISKDLSGIFKSLPWELRKPAVMAGFLLFVSFLKKHFPKGVLVLINP